MCYRCWINTAPKLADQRFQGASNVKELEQLQNNLEEFRLKKKTQEDRLAAIKTDQSYARSAFHSASRNTRTFRRV